MKILYAFAAIIVLSLLTLSLVLFLSNSSEESENVYIPETEKLIQKWYVVAEDPTHKIYTSGKKGGDIIVVLDKELDTFLTPSESCEVLVPENIENKKDFYNDTVGITEVGPYKSIFYDTELDTFYQSVLNSGCVSTEGTIAIETDEETLKANCTINVQFEHIGC